MQLVNMKHTLKHMKHLSENISLDLKVRKALYVLRLAFIQQNVNLSPVFNSSYLLAHQGQRFPLPPQSRIQIANWKLFLARLPTCISDINTAAHHIWKHDRTQPKCYRPLLACGHYYYYPMPDMSACTHLCTYSFNQTIMWMFIFNIFKWVLTTHPLIK